jgi:hypothetical protein
MFLAAALATGAASTGFAAPKTVAFNGRNIPLARIRGALPNTMGTCLGVKDGAVVAHQVLVVTDCNDHPDQEGWLFMGGWLANGVPGTPLCAGTNGDPHHDGTHLLLTSCARGLAVEFEHRPGGKIQEVGTNLCIDKNSMGGGQEQFHAVLRRCGNTFFNANQFWTIE